MDVFKKKLFTDYPRCKVITDESTRDCKNWIDFEVCDTRYIRTLYMGLGIEILRFKKNKKKYKRLGYM